MTFPLFDYLVIKKQEKKSLRKKLMKLWAKRIKKHEENAEKTNITGNYLFNMCIFRELPLVNYFSGLRLFVEYFSPIRKKG